MKTASTFIILFLISLLMVGAAPGLRAQSESIREPVCAGMFYPSNPAELSKLIDDFAKKARAEPVAIPDNRKPRALVLPHAGYIYSGPTAAYASLALRAHTFDTVIVMAPDHRVGFYGGAISAADAYRTPLGLVRIHAAADDLRRKYDFFSSNRLSDNTEHAVEVVLPILQHFLGDFELIPLVLGRCSPEPVAAALIPLLNPQTLLVVSSDLSHYLPYARAVARDRRTIEMILNLDDKALAEQENAACGRTALLVLLKIAKQLNWRPLCLHYANSGDTAGDKDRVVGYTAIAFYADPFEEQDAADFPPITIKQERQLVRLARFVIKSRLSGTDAVFPGLSRLRQQPELQACCGTFVTLKRNGRLRGCIGNLSDSMPILEGIQLNAIQAAFHDPRFPPLKPKELAELEIEISILSRPKPLEYQSSADLISKLRVNVDGVILSKGFAGATFLPQVWQELPDPEQFLSHLCRKAGLPFDAWRKTPLKVMTYQVRHFDETN